MKALKFYFGLINLLVVVISGFLFSFVVQQAEPWTPDQLMEPADLAIAIEDAENLKPHIISIGPGAVIKGSHDIGPAGEKANLKKLENHLNTLQRDADIVIYCGCCPFNKCPNIRPAFTLLNKMEFSNHKLLNISQNIKTNWIDRGYPVSE